MTRLILLAALLAAAPAAASTAAADAAVEKASAAACLKAAGLKNGKVGTPVRFSDTLGVDAREVTGTWAQPHMRGAKARMLCLYDRRTRAAEVQEAAKR